MEETQMNPKFEAMRAQVELMRAERAQARKLQDTQNEDHEVTYHASVASLIEAIRAERNKDDQTGDSSQS